MARYQVLNVTDTKNLYSLFKFINTSANNLFFPVILGVIWIIACLGVLADGRPLSRGFTFASFICSIISVILVLLQVLTPAFMYMMFIFTALGVFWIYLTSGFD
jgi:hypothetical protein